jgi:hypothetical protein
MAMLLFLSHSHICLSCLSDMNLTIWLGISHRYIVDSILIIRCWWCHWCDRRLRHRHRHDGSSDGINVISIIKTIGKYWLSKPDVSIYRPKYRYIGDNIGLNCHRCKYPKIATPSTTSTIQDINTINIDVSNIITINIDKNHFIPSLISHVLPWPQPSGSADHRHGMHDPMVFNCDVEVVVEEALAGHADVAVSLWNLNASTNLF